MAKPESIQTENQYGIYVRVKDLGYTELLQRLSNAEIYFVVTGGWALKLQIPEANQSPEDLDLFILADEVNIGRLKLFLVGLGVAGESIDRVCTPCSFIRMLTADGQLDIGHHIHGVNFRIAYKDSVAMDVCGVKVRVMNMHRMWQNKLESYHLTSRPKDLIHIGLLRKHLFGF